MLLDSFCCVSSTNCMHPGPFWASAFWEFNRRCELSRKGFCVPTMGEALDALDFSLKFLIVRALQQRNWFNFNNLCNFVKFRRFDIELGILASDPRLRSYSLCNIGLSTNSVLPPFPLGAMGIYSMLVERQVCKMTWPFGKVIWQFLIELNINLSPVLLGFYPWRPRTIYVHTTMHAQFVRALLFLTAPAWRQPKCPSPVV